VNFMGTPTGMFRLAAVTVSESSFAEFTVSVAVPEILPEVAVMVVAPIETATAMPVLSIVATD
jgi:hypothetical protein